MTETLSLLGWTPRGATIDLARDKPRLGEQLQAVFDFMRSGQWATLREISAHAGAPEASVSARLRDLRRLGFTVEREYVVKGIWRYCLVQ